MNDIDILNKILKKVFLNFLIYNVNHLKRPLPHPPFFKPWSKVVRDSCDCTQDIQKFEII